MRIVALTGCLLLAVFTPPTPTPTDTDVPPTTLLFTAPPPPRAIEPEAVASAEETPPPAPPMMAEGIDVEPAPSIAIRAVHGCDAAAEALCTVDPPPVTPDGPDGARCPQWWGEARDVGWPENQLWVMDRVMWCESKCGPGAHNGSGASGLMQLMPMWWRGIGDPYDPVFNLARALDVLHAQGWRAWSCY